MGDIVKTSASPIERATRNEEAVAAVAAMVKRSYILRIGDKGYLMVAGAQAIASSLGYTTGVESVRYVPANETLPGYWEAIAVVRVDGVEVGRGLGSVFDDERAWKGRDQFARQMMAQTRATGRALKGVMGWAVALLGAETSLAEEMPGDGPTMAQEPSAAPRRVQNLANASEGSKGQPDASGKVRRIRGRLSGVQAKQSKAGKPYWRVGLEAPDGVTDWLTSFDEVTIQPGVEVELTLKPYRDGEIVTDCVALPVGEEVPF